MKSKEFVRDFVLPAGGVLERVKGDHHVYRLPNGRTFDVPMGGRQTEASQFLLPKLRRLLRLGGATVAVLAAALVWTGCGGAPFTAADGPVPDGGAEVPDAVSGPDIAADVGSRTQGGEAGEDGGGEREAETVDSGDLHHVDSGGGSGGSSSSGGGLSSSGGSGGGSGGVIDAGPCDGGVVYTHDAGVDGVTWQDCAPTGTYDATQALAACAAYAAHDLATSGCSGSCQQPNDDCSTAVGNSTVFYNGGCGDQVVWTYANSSAPGHVRVVAAAGLACPSSSDPSWN